MYNITVRASNAEGYSPPSSPLVIQTEQGARPEPVSALTRVELPPGLPTVLWIAAQWQRPISDYPILHYTIYAHGSPSKTFQASGEATQLSMRMDIPEQVWEMTISATSQGGESMLSPPVNMSTTPALPPFAPQVLLAGLPKSYYSVTAIKLNCAQSLYCGPAKPSALHYACCGRACACLDARDHL